MKNYSDKEKLDLIDRMEKDCMESVEIQALENPSWIVKNADMTERLFFVLEAFTVAIFVISQDSHDSDDILLKLGIVATVIGAIGTCIFNWIDSAKKRYYSAKKHYSDVIDYRDSMIEDFSNMRNVILKPDEAPYYYFGGDGEDDCDGVINYFEKYAVNHPSETDRAIFAEILMDASEKIYRLGQKRLDNEKEELDRFVVSFINK